MGLASPERAVRRLYSVSMREQIDPRNAIRFTKRAHGSQRCGCNWLRMEVVSPSPDGTKCASNFIGVDPLSEVGIFMCRLWPAILLCLISSLSLAVSTPDKSPAAGALQTRERRFTRSLVRAAQFVDVRHISSRPSCGDVQPPDALTTPDPLFTTSAFGHKVKVSFIIGIDGRVHSPLILESAGLAGDRRVLQTVRTWRYRPATCNGVPTETEGKVEFSTR